MAEPRTPITDPQRLKALAHPLRWKLIRLIGTEETATATKCAEVLGESVASCSYHLNMLAKYGFVEEAEGGQGREKPWKLTTRRHTLDTEGLDDEAKMAVEAASDAFLETEFEEIRTQLRKGDLEPKAWHDAVGSRSSSMWVTEAEAAEMTAAFNELSNRFQDRWDNPELRPEGARQIRIFMASYFIPRYPDH
ncbi:MAG TPA: helix-turn-helix domain-containing protein [Pseudonocardiaceae bacterium]|nr:helix-turn-helix domain-containing protein [Pseudonocardiaceae bacterium]